MLFRRKKKSALSEWEVPYDLPAAENIKEAARLLRDEDIPARLRAQMVVIALSRTGAPLFPEMRGTLRPGTITWMTGVRGSGISEAALAAQFRAMMNGMTTMKLCAHGEHEAVHDARRLEDGPRTRGQEKPVVANSPLPEQQDVTPYVTGPDHYPPAQAPMVFIHDGWDPRAEKQDRALVQDVAFDKAMAVAPGYDLVVLSLSRQNDPTIEAGRALAASGKTVILLSMEPYWALGEIAEDEAALIGRCLAPFYFSGAIVDATRLKPGEVFYKRSNETALRGVPCAAPYLGSWRNPLMATSCRHVMGPVTDLISQGVREMKHGQALERIARMAGYSSWMAACQKRRKEAA